LKLSCSSEALIPEIAILYAFATIVTAAQRGPRHGAPEVILIQFFARPPKVHAQLRDFWPQC